ncbi:MAG: hypothetical protein ACQEQD_10275 [Bacillota bacterium]
MTNFKRFSFFVVLLLLILALTPNLLLAQGSNEIPLDKLKTPTKLQDIIDTFDRLKYNFKAFNEGEKAQELMVEFQYQGLEEVQGVQADKLIIESSAMETSKISQMEFWLDDGEIIRIVQEGQEIPIAMVDTMKEKMLEAFFFPFYYFEKLNLEEIASEGEVTKSQEMIGEKEVDIIKIKGNNLPEYGLKSGTMELADFDKLLMMVSFDYITLDEAEAKFEEGQFEIEEIELR